MAPGQVDVAIVGAGAAGVAAGRQLSRQGHSTLLIEALPRLGGRAHTASLGGMALDLGCGWLHSATRNPLAREARKSGLPLRHGDGAWRHRLPPVLSALQDQSQGWVAYAALADRLRDQPPASDVAGESLAPDAPWRPFIDAISTFANGVELDDLSAADFLNYEDGAGGENWRLEQGYGAFIAGLADGLPQALSTKVLSVIQADEVVLETDKGPIRAKAAIVTVSTNVLAAGDIRFVPAIDDHMQAAAALPLGLANKVLLSLPEAHRLPAEAHLMGDLNRTRTGSYYVRPFGRPLIEGFLAGANARDLERAGEAAALAFVREELAGLFDPAFARGLKALAVTSWGQEPTIGGSYSHARPGQALARAVLARPASERLCLAGEACSPTDFSTAHGAWESGLAAAAWVAQGLGRPAASPTTTKEERST